MKKTITYDLDESGASVSTFIDKPLISSYIDVYMYDRWFFGKGHAKCHPTDKFDEAFGESLAMVRAYTRLYRKMEKHLIRKAG